MFYYFNFSAYKLSGKVLIKTSVNISNERTVSDFFSKCKLQSTLVISKSKGPSETLRDIRTSTYQRCSIKENTNFTNEHVI